MAAAGDDEDLVSLDVSSMSDVSDGEVGEQQGEVSSGAVAPAVGALAFSFTPGDHDLLVRLVKRAQKMKYTTSGGPWADWIPLHVSHSPPKNCTTRQNSTNLAACACRSCSADFACSHKVMLFGRAERSAFSLPCSESPFQWRLRLAGCCPWTNSRYPARLPGMLWQP